MASRSTKKDLYTNVLTVTCQQSAANTITFEEIDIGLNLFDKVGLLVSRIDFQFSRAALQELTQIADEIDFGIVTSNQLTSLSFEQQAVIDMGILSVNVASGVGFVQDLMPITHDWSRLPGGGLLLAPKPLYLAIDSAGMASARGVDARIFFTIIRLSDSDYLELIETRRYIG